MGIDLLGDDGMVNLNSEFVSRIMAFTRGETDLENLQAWVSDWAPELAGSDQPEIRAIHGRFWRMLGEYGRDDRSIESFRHDLIQSSTPSIGAGRAS